MKILIRFLSSKLAFRMPKVRRSSASLKKEEKELPRNAVQRKKKSGLSRDRKDWTVTQVRTKVNPRTMKVKFNSLKIRFSKTFSIFPTVEVVSLRLTKNPDVILLDYLTQDQVSQASLKFTLLVQIATTPMSIRLLPLIHQEQWVLRLMYLKKILLQTNWIFKTKFILPSRIHSTWPMATTKLSQIRHM